MNNDRLQAAVKEAKAGTYLCTNITCLVYFHPEDWRPHPGRSPQAHFEASHGNGWTFIPQEEVPPGNGKPRWPAEWAYHDGDNWA